MVGFSFELFGNDRSVSVLEIRRLLPFFLIDTLELRAKLFYAFPDRWTAPSESLMLHVARALLFRTFVDSKRLPKRRLAGENKKK